MTNPVYGIKWKHDRLTDLDFADDIALLNDSHDSSQDMTTKLHDQPARLGLRSSCEKTKAMSVALEQSPPVTVGQQTLEYVDNFPYLGSYISRTDDAEVDTRARLSKAATPPNMEQQDHQHDHQVTSVQINCDSGSNLCS